MKGFRRGVVSFLFAAAAAGILVSGCGRRSGRGEHFGEPFTQAPVVTLAQLQEAPDTFYRKAVRVKGVIERQCPVAGCWFFLNDGQGRSIKVELGDYLSKLPQKIGHSAEVEGEWIKKGTAYEFIGTRVTFSGKESP